MATKTAEGWLRGVIPHTSDCACMGCHADGRYDTYCGAFCEHTPFQVELAIENVLHYDLSQERRLWGKGVADTAFRVLKAELVAQILYAEWPEARS